MNVLQINLSAVASTFLVVFMSMTSRADSPATSNRPETLKVTAGDVVTRVEAAKMWTISGLEFRGTVMSTEDSAYGTVVTYPGHNQHLGTAHFLEIPGKPGEIEKENVIDLKFFVDDKPVADGIAKDSPKAEVAGKTFRMERKSTIRSFQLESSVRIQDNIVIETAHLKSPEAVELQQSYPLMYAWTPEAEMFVFGDDTGITKRGSFLGPDGKKSDEGLEKAARWMSVYEPRSNKGAVCYLLQHPKDATGWFQYTDAPKIYRKLRIMSFVNTTVPAGFDGTFQSIVGFFESDAANWEQAAQKRVNELKSYAAKLEKP